MAGVDHKTDMGAAGVQAPGAIRWEYRSMRPGQLAISALKGPLAGSLSGQRTNSRCLAVATPALEGTVTGAGHVDASHSAGRQDLYGNGHQINAALVA